MDEEINFYEQIVASQLQLRKVLKKEPIANVPLLDIVDAEITMLNEIIVHLRYKNK